MTVLALEEVGKIPALFDLSTRDHVGRWKEFWRSQFSAHGFKQAESSRYGRYLAASGESPYLFTITETMVKTLDRVKQWGFYVDCHEGRFKSPCEFGFEIRDVLDYLYARDRGTGG